MNLAKAKLYHGSLMIRVSIRGQEPKVGFVFAFVLMLAMSIPGCRRTKNVSRISPTITRKGELSWQCDFSGHTRVDVKAYLSRASIGLEKAFENQQTLRDENLKRCHRMANLAPTKELRETYREEIELYEKQLFRFAGSWENWPLVIVVPVLLEDVEPTKALVICRYQPKLLDIIFAMYCPYQITHRDFLRIAKELTLEFRALNELQWEEIPIRDEPMLSDEGDIILGDILKFAEDSVFIKQR
jgi:hypothetical protein